MGMFAATISVVPYWSGVLVVALVGVVLCVGARRRPGQWTRHAAQVIGLVLLGDCVVDTIRQFSDGTWSVHTSLPLALCNFALLVAAAACWRRTPQLVELTYNWGLAGTLQGLLTPDLNVPFPRVEFFEYVIGHALIVVAALYLVVGLRLEPRRGSVVRCSLLTYAYVAIVALADVVFDANYMFLRRAPHQWTLLRLMGPYPWYLVTGVVLVPLFFALLYSPFWFVRRVAQRRTTPSTAPTRLH
jgi:hypothetical integral membrane protein (TIGR02206 family)